MFDAMLRPLPERHPAPPIDGLRPTVGGKFFFIGPQKFYMRAVSYGPFATPSHGFPFPPEAVLERDFTLMRQAGVNVVRTFTVPPRWLLDRAQAHGLRVLVTIPWMFYTCFLDDPELMQETRGIVRGAATSLGGHPALFGFLLGNEIPPDIVPWHGPDGVAGFLRVLADDV
jgi:hypothetical protein